MELKTYPATGSTNANLLYKGLGTFWTQVFQERATLKGLTQAQAEELIQRQYDLIEVLDSYAVKDVHIFHKEKWHPIVLFKSKLNQAPLQFQPDDAVFGPQPATDPYYAGVEFQFGFPKIPSAEVYTYTPDESIKKMFVLADKVINPAIVLVKGTDVVIRNDVLFFNKDVFNMPELVKTPVISDLGEPVTYTDLNGNVQEDETVTLWMYHGELDRDAIWRNFGVLFNLHHENNQFYKDLMKAIFAMYVDGPTVKSIKTLCATLLEVPVVETAEEVVEVVFTDSQYHHVVTNKATYKFDVFYTVLPHVVPGAIVKAGDVLVDATAYYDAVTYPNWWTRDVLTAPAPGYKPYLSLSKNLFVGNYSFQLTFKSGIDIVSISAADELKFPVVGSAEDIAEFNRQIDTPTMRTALGLTGPGSVAVVNPVDFLFRNFFKNNTALVKLKFRSAQVTSAFLSAIDSILTNIPRHIYMIFDMLLSMPTETYSELNGATPITFSEGNTQILNADGSNSDGAIEKIAPLDYLDVKKRLFSVGKSPERVDEQVYCNEPTSLIDDDSGGTIGMVVNMGSVDSNGYAIPVRPIPVGASTATYSTLLLLKFV